MTRYIPSHISTYLKLLSSFSQVICLIYINDVHGMCKNGRKGNKNSFLGEIIERTQKGLELISLLLLIETFMSEKRTKTLCWE